jgi:predicted nucleotidyltransferase
MPKHTPQTDINHSYHYSPATREATLNRLLTALRSDERIAGLLVVGSGAEGFADVYSDIDLCAVTTSADDVRPAFQEWGVKIREMLSVFHSFESVRGANIYLWILLLENFLEIDLCFLCLDDLHATRNRWKTVFDRSGRIEGIMQSSWENRPKPNLEEIYRYRLGSIWHYISYAAVAVQRDQPWRAMYEIEQIRNQTIELRGLRAELETKRFRHVDQMSEDFLTSLEQTLVLSLRDVDLMNALRAATTCFFREAQHFDEMLDLKLAECFEIKVKAYLELFERNP